jgi:hypothetical protein
MVKETGKKTAQFFLTIEKYTNYMICLGVSHFGDAFKLQTLRWPAAVPNFCNPTFPADTRSNRELKTYQRNATPNKGSDNPTCQIILFQ